MLLSWIAILTCMAGASSAEPAPFSPYRAEYTVARGGSEIGFMQAELTRREDGLWHYSIESRATALLVRMLGISSSETGWMEWRDGRVRPLTYHNVSSGPRRNRFWQNRYDWPDAAVEINAWDGNFRPELPAGAVDPLALRLEAVARVSRMAPEFASFEVDVVERDELERQQYNFLGLEAVEIDGRCYRTAKFERFRKPESGRNYLAWHARELGWLPVRIAHVEDGKPIEIELAALQSNAYSLPPRQACTKGAQPE